MHAYHLDRSSSTCKSSENQLLHLPRKDIQNGTDLTKSKETEILGKITKYVRTCKERDKKKKRMMDETKNHQSSFGGERQDAQVDEHGQDEDGDEEDAEGVSRGADEEEAGEPGEHAVVGDGDRERGQGEGPAGDAAAGREQQRQHRQGRLGDAAPREPVEERARGHVVGARQLVALGPPQRLPCVVHSPLVGR